MFENLRKTLTPKTGKSQPKSLKHYVAYVIFGAIIVVFALFGANKAEMGDASGGVAAVVNDTSISIAEYRNRVDNVEQNARGRFDQFPEAQRRMLQNELRKRALEELILQEVVYQAADKKGIMASDGEVRDYISEIPFLSDKGKFQRDRYKQFLTNQSMTSESFERQVRKQIVNQRLQELFVGAATPTREELKRNRVLANQKLNIRFVEIPKADVGKMISEAELRDYKEKQKAAIEKYYADNKVEFQKSEKVRARHILIGVNDKRTEADAAKLAAEVHKQVNAKNFAELAKKYSDDPGSKEKGGSLPEFEHGRMIPAFEQKAFAQKAGEISEPVKSDYGFHIIETEAKIPAQTESLEQATDAIARKLVVRQKEGEVLAALNKAAESGNKKELDAMLVKAGGKWQETGEFDLSSNTIPKIGDNPQLMSALLKTGHKGGLVKQVVENKGNLLASEILSWKEAPDKNPDVEGIDRMVAYRKSADLIEGWSKDVEAKASISRNPQLLR